MDNMSSCLSTHIHEVFKDMEPPSSHLLPTYIKYEVIIDMSDTYNNVRENLQKTSILK